MYSGYPLYRKVGERAILFGKYLCLINKYIANQ